MLTNRLSSRAPMILRGCSYHTPAASIAFSRALASPSWRKNSNTAAKISTTPKGTYSLTKCYKTSSAPLAKIPLIDRHWFATQPIICSHEYAFARDMSLDEFDNAYNFLYAQHNHPRGPWVKMLQSAQHILAGQKSPRILVIGSGPGEPAATLATNFLNADVVSAHSTAKCIEWANQRFNSLGLSNVESRLVPSMENLDRFADGSFDLVVSSYGLANTSNPQAALDEIHRVLKPGGSFLASVWEQLPADPGSDIILRHACIGPNPWHKTEDNIDAVGEFRCPVRTKRPMSLAKPHLRKFIDTALFFDILF
jgi:SAM-dependent methyltransferase